MEESLYNARITSIQWIHDALIICRVVPDFPMPAFAAGQYATLGVGVWESRNDEPGPVEDSGQQSGKLIRRPYSVSCPILGTHGELVTCADLDYLEFYIALVRLSDQERPRLTPRLFRLREGDRLFLSPHLHGSYKLDSLNPRDTVLFLSTGTGEAPHNAMLAELLKGGHPGRIIAAVCVRNRFDLGYLETHRELERRYGNYQYVALTTREPENLDPSLPDYVGKQYLQNFISGGQAERELGFSLNPDNTQVYVCGNPDMIGLPQPAEPGKPAVPPPGGMIDILTQRGFQLDQPHSPGNIHVERYW